MTHVETIVTGFFEPESYAECSCGFKGPMRPTELAAAEDLVDHRQRNIERNRMTNAQIDLVNEVESFIAHLERCNCVTHEEEPMIESIRALIDMVRTQ